jgi:hypothetical protein
VHEAQGGRLVADDEDGLGVELAMRLQGQLHQVGLAVPGRVPDHGVGLRRLDLVDQRVAIGRARVAGGPDEPRGHARRQYLPEGRADPAAGDHVDDALVQERHLGHRRRDRDAAHPDVRWRVVDEAPGPVARA